MVPLLLLLLTAASVKPPGAELRKSCSAEAEPVSAVPAGAVVTIRFAMSGQRVTCYKVTVETPDGPRDGYLLQTALENLDEFEAARRAARRVEPREVLAAARAVVPSGGGDAAGARVAQEALTLMETGQPGRALSMLEAEMKTTRDPALLALAGAAAWRGDDPRRALQYWKESLALRPDPALAGLYARVEREAAADQSNQRIAGMRVTLRYEGTAVTPEAAREMVAVLDRESGRISERLGCSARERIVAIVQSEEAYRKATGAAEWSGGQFDGRIRVPVFDGARVDDNLRRALAHELVHACLSMLGRWPAWLHEGVAQYVSGEVLSADQRRQIRELADRKALPKLENLGQNWSSLSAAEARLAYALALRAIEVFETEMSAWGLRNLLANPTRLPQIAAELDRRLGL
jgi:hypothetical protein